MAVWYACRSLFNQKNAIFRLTPRQSISLTWGFAKVCTQTKMAKRTKLPFSAIPAPKRGCEHPDARLHTPAGRAAPSDTLRSTLACGHSTPRGARPMPLLASGTRPPRVRGASGTAQPRHHADRRRTHPDARPRARGTRPAPRRPSQRTPAHAPPAPRHRATRPCPQPTPPPQPASAHATRVSPAFARRASPAEPR